MSKHVSAPTPAPLSFSFLLKEFVNNLLCLVVACLVSQLSCGFGPAILSSLSSRLKLLPLWTLAWTPQYILSIPSGQHTQFLYPLCLLHSLTAHLLVSDIWTTKHSWGNHKTTQTRANKNPVSTLSTTKQSFYIAGQLSPLPHRDNSIIFYHFEPRLLLLPHPVTSLLS